MYKSLVFFIAFSTFLSCNTVSQESEELYIKINENLVNSSNAIEASNITIYRTLKDDSENPITNSMAKYYERALTVKDKSDKVCQYIDSIRKVIKIRNNMVVSKQISNDLFAKLSNYISDVLSFNNDVGEIFKSDTIIDFLGIKSKMGNENSFFDLYFANAEGLKNILVFNMLHNNVRLAENRIITYCVSNYCKLKIKYVKP
mgnify:FL=1